MASRPRTSPNTIRPHAQGRSQKHIGAAGLGIPIRNQRHGIRLLGAQFCRLLDGNDPLFGRDQGEDLPRRDRLAGRGAARDDHVELVLNAEPQGGIDVAGGHHIAQGGIPFAA
jgi:hypothetical protein